MASVIRVDSIQGTNGANIMTNGYLQRPGTIIETLTSVCDGSTVTVGSGSYTFQNVTTYQQMQTSYTDISGSVISYTPPAGATKVIYNFDFSYCHQTAGVIAHYKFFIDSTEVLYARRTISGESSYPHVRQQFVWPIAIGGSDNSNTGRVANWNTAKTLRVSARSYSGSYYGNWNYSQYWDGAGGGMFAMPILTITAIA